jgi:hypothetical protein
MICSALIFLALTFPGYFDAEQQVNALLIISKAKDIGEDPYHLIATAWVESRVKANKVSGTGDYGIFQINWSFWGRKWGYTDKKKFLKDMSDPYHSTVAAAVVLKEMRRYKTCQGLNLPACYNGGPSWQKSRNIKAILRYANNVNWMADVFRRRYPGWGK